MTLPQGWETVRFDEVTPAGAPIIYGILQPGPFVTDGVPYVRPSEIECGDIDAGAIRRTSPEISSRYARSKLQTGDLILSIVGTIGKVAEVPAWLDGGNITQSSCRIRPNTKIVSGRFLKSYLVSPASVTHFSENKLGTAVPRLNLVDVRKIKLPLPPLAEQRRIVAKLDALTSRIVCAREELDRISILASNLRNQSLKLAYNGALTADWRGDVHSSTYVGSLPATWRSLSLGRIADIKSGLTLGKKRNPGDELIELPYLRVANVQRGSLDLEVIKRVSVTAREADMLYLQPGDILMNEGGDRDKLGRGCVWNGEIQHCIHQNHVFRVRLKGSDALPRYVSHYANEFGSDYFFEHGTQTTNLASLSKTKLSALPLPLAPVEEQAEILNRLDAVFARADRLEAEAARATTLLDRLEASILAKAFRGELVPQDPADEPASALLDRIRTERAAAPQAKRGRRVVSAASS